MTPSFLVGFAETIGESATFSDLHLTDHHLGFSLGGHEMVTTNSVQINQVNVILLVIIQRS
jgi:hypothetical protein